MQRRNADYGAMKVSLFRNLPADSNDYKAWTGDQLVGALSLQLSPQEYAQLKNKADAHQRLPRFYKRYNMEWRQLAWRHLYSMAMQACFSFSLQ
jgi:hypothetical protein